MGGLVQDIRFGVRMLFRNPGVTVVAVLCLGFGIGGTASVFSAVNAVLVHPIPFDEPDRLVSVYNEVSVSGTVRASAQLVHYADFLDYREQNRSFDHLAAYASTSYNLSGHGPPERVAVGMASAGLFPLLRVEPQLGRGFSSEDEGFGTESVAILSHGLWARRFGASADVLG